MSALAAPALPRATRRAGTPTLGRLRDRGPMPPSALAAEQWIRAFVALYLEVEAGLRPARHLRPLMAPDLQALVWACGRVGRIPEVRSILVQARPGVCEAVVLLEDGDQVAALAVAVRRDDRGWRVAEVRRPDAPRHPAPRPPDVLLQARRWHEITPTDSRPEWVLPNGWRRHQEAARAA